MTQFNVKLDANVTDIGPYSIQYYQIMGGQTFNSPNNAMYCGTLDDAINIQRDILKSQDGVCVDLQNINMNIASTNTPYIIIENTNNNFPCPSAYCLIYNIYNSQSVVKRKTNLLRSLSVSLDGYGNLTDACLTGNTWSQGISSPTLRTPFFGQYTGNTVNDILGKQLYADYACTIPLTFSNTRYFKIWFQDSTTRLTEISANGTVYSFDTCP